MLAQNQFFNTFLVLKKRYPDLPGEVERFFRCLATAVSSGLGAFRFGSNILGIVSVKKKKKKKE